ncbi:Motile Sperm domain containing protein [Trichuris trichiura]|uniref:Major sperm protein n=1 Tax=Trichuris trichiura TaxID=36087 RepID=A0A077Z9A8_TRITR|nr:Motile Sperm domain containing protein [Trichuris trichiura]
MEFVSGSRKATVEVYPVDTIHFSRSFDITQLASIQLYNNSTEWIAYKLRTTSPAEIKFRPGYGFLQPFRMKKILVRCTRLPDEDMERTERCTVVAHVLPEGVKAVNAYDYWKSMMFTNLIDKKCPLEVKFDLDSYDVPEPVSTSSYTSSSIIATTSSPEESESTTSSSESVITSTSSSSRESGTYTTTSSIDSTTTVSSSGSSVAGRSTVSTTGTSVESFTVGSEATASNGSFTEQSY